MGEAGGGYSYPDGPCPESTYGGQCILPAGHDDEHENGFCYWSVFPFISAEPGNPFARRRAGQGRGHSPVRHEGSGEGQGQRS